MKRLICGALVAASLVCGVGCTPKIEYVDRVEYVDREVIVEVPVETIKEVIVEVPVETIKEVVKTQTVYTPFDISQINILTPTQVDELEVGDTITNILIYKGYLATGIKQIKGLNAVSKTDNYDRFYSIDFSAEIDDYYSNIYFTGFGAPLSSNWCISGTVKEIVKHKNEFGYTQSITIYINETKGE